MQQLSRATSVETLGAKFAAMFDEETHKLGLAVKLRPSDVVITPFGKSGTTWTQQIVHCLRTRGDMDFDDISRVVPWIEISPALGIDLDAEQKANPRAFKSHLAWSEIPLGFTLLTKPSKHIAYNRINQPLMVNTDNSVDSNTELAALSCPRLYMAANK
jgi:hypothetical protein